MKQFLPLSMLFLFYTYSSAQQLTGYSTDDSSEQIKLEEKFRASIDPTRFKTHLKKLTEKPHVAGTPNNELVKDYMIDVMEKSGFDVKAYPYEVYLSTGPGESKIEVISPERIRINQKESVVKEDPYSSHVDLQKAWNAYSGNGDVTAEIVYANYGRKEDFEKLKELGVNVSGKIVIARYGGNFRGYKAKFAEAHGASGLIIYTDPSDSGYMKGLVYPEGPNYNDSAIQRGSLLTADWTGDPLTPYTPALVLDDKNTPIRLSPNQAGLHNIPVTPIAYGAAKQIFKHMKGQAVPEEWQGGLPYTYRLEGGENLTLRLVVKQPKGYTKIYNVVGTLKGKTYADEWIILGCHYDAWAFGATDPNSGTAMLLSLSETLGKMASNGMGPDRSILIAHWDAEEHGVIGSTEWVEHFKTELQAKAIAYINLDAAVSGKRFSAASSPSLKGILAESTKLVDYPYSDKTVYEEWANTKDVPDIGNLGGGSDHIGFYMHAGIPSLSAGYRGKTLYHTNYDDFYFYENFVDQDFQIGPTLEAVIGTLSRRLSNATFLAYDLERYPTDLKIHFANAESKIKAYYPEFKGFEKSSNAIKNLEKSAKLASEGIAIKASDKRLKTKTIKEINKKLLALEKSFLLAEGLPFGDWYKSIYVSSDPYSGYASWILPGIEYQIEAKNKANFSKWDEIYAEAINTLDDNLNSIINQLK